MIDQILQMKNKEMKQQCRQMLFEMMLKDPELSQKVKREIYKFVPC